MATSNAALAFLAPRDYNETPLETVTENIDEFMRDWLTPELRQAHDALLWCRRPSQIDLHEHLLDLARVWKREDSILDVGCYAGYLHDYFGPPKYLGIDILPEAIEAARHLHPGVAFKVGDVFSLEDRADVVWCSRVLIHLPRFAEAVKKLCEAATKWVVIVLAIGNDECTRIRGQNDIYYFRRFSTDTVSRACAPFGKTTIIEHGTYATVLIDRSRPGRE